MEPYTIGQLRGLRPKIRLVGYGLLVVAGYLGTLRVCVAGWSRPGERASSDTPTAPVAENERMPGSEPVENSTQPDSPDKPDDGKADLGPQPVLLWDRVARPAYTATRLPSVYPPAEAVHSVTLIHAIPYQWDSPIVDVAAFQPVMLAGFPHCPHGPPTRSR